MYLLDTNVVIHYLNNTLPVSSIRFLNRFIDENCNVSVITQMETLGFNFKNKADKEVTEIFIENSTVLEINTEVVKKTIAIRKSRKINLPDAIIAATAIVLDFTLITQNTKDFDTIQNLKILHSFEL